MERVGYSIMNELIIRPEAPGEQLTVIRLSGVFEGMAAVEGEIKLSEILKDIQTKNVWIDLSEIVYIDSSAVGVLINLTKAAVAQKVQMSFFKPSENVKKILNITHVDRMIPIIEG